MKRIASTALVVLGWQAQSALAIPCHGQNLPVCTFQNDYNGFQTTMAAIAAPISRITFETLPDGTPSHGGVYITPTFNYTQQGVTFSTPPVYPFYPFIAGSGPGAYGLRAYSGTPIVRDWLIADLTVPNRAVGIFYAGGTTLSAYDGQGSLIGSVSSPAQGFLGIISDTAIIRAIGDRGADIEGWDDFVFSPIVPEPCTAALLFLGGPVLIRRRPR